LLGRTLRGITAEVLFRAHFRTAAVPAAVRKPGFPLQFLSPPAAGFRYFRFNPLRGPLCRPCPCRGGGRRLAGRPSVCYA
jgi:hypothetical protein